MNIRRLFALLLFTSVATLLASCEVYVYGVGDQFRLESAVYTTGYTYNGTSVVCDDRTTNIEVVLRYRGEIEFVSVILAGQDSGRTHSLSSFSPTASENANGEVRRTFSVRSGLSPLGATLINSGEEVLGEVVQPISPQSIIVVPVNPTVIGYTKIEVRIETEYEDSVLSSREIPVLNFCN